VKSPTSLKRKQNLPKTVKWVHSSLITFSLFECIDQARRRAKEIKPAIIVILQREEHVIPIQLLATPVALEL
jgi:hypothetical protein